MKKRKIFDWSSLGTLQILWKALIFNRFQLGTVMMFFSFKHEFHCSFHGNKCNNFFGKQRGVRVLLLTCHRGFQSSSSVGLGLFYKKVGCSNFHNDRVSEQVSLTTNVRLNDVHNPEEKQSSGTNCCLLLRINLWRNSRMVASSW